MAPTTDPLGDAITVLENVRIEMPSARRDTEDAQNRVNLALEYLRMIGTIRGQALVEYARQRSNRPDVIEALDELEKLVRFREAPAIRACQLLREAVLEACRLIWEEDAEAMRRALRDDSGSLPEPIDRLPGALHPYWEKVRRGE